VSTSTDRVSAPAQKEPRFERPSTRPPRLRETLAALDASAWANGLVAATFSMTGPVAVILAVGTRGGLSPAEISSWVFGVFFLNGVLTVLAGWLYRQPLAFFWTIPGTVVVGKSLGHLSWPEVVGAFVATGLLILALSLTGQVRRVMELLPGPVVMAMVAGVFLRFGLDLVDALITDATLVVPMVAAFALLTAAAGLRVPPVLGALLVGVVAVLLAGRYDPAAGARWLADPVFTEPAFSWAAMVELVVPLAITVLVVQNGQGMAVLTAAGHRPPMNVATLACGVWSLGAAAVGAVSTCLTGPTNALLVASGRRERQYAAGIVCGLLAVAFGLLAPGLVRTMLGMPVAFVAALGGLAMLRPLQAAFVAAFGGRLTLAALVTFLVAVADLTVWNIGGAFWGLVAGMLTARLLEPDDLRP
jgi:benzoate membrane transport protein